MRSLMRCPIQIAFAVERILAESPHDLRQSGRSRCDQFAGDLVGIDHRRSTGFEEFHDGAFAGGDPPGQADDQGSPWKARIPVVEDGLMVESRGGGRFAEGTVKGGRGSDRIRRSKGSPI